MFFYIIIIALFLLGLSEFIFGIKLFFIKPKNCTKKDLIIILNSYDCCLEIAEAISKMNWYNDLYDRVLAVTDYITEEEHKKCKDVVMHYKSDKIVFCEKSQLIEYISHGN